MRRVAWAWLVLCLLVAPACAPPAAPSNLGIRGSAVMALLKAIPRLASTRAWARWQLSDGSVIEMPLTTREYTDLALRGAGAPARPPAVPADATWIAAAGGVLMWDTPDGRLPLGGYDQRRTDWVLLGLEELDPS